MKRNDVISTMHPLVSFLYFFIVIVMTMFYMHPMVLTITFAGGLIYNAYLKRMKATLIQGLVLLPTMILTALINPAFNHEGATILMYFKNGNPLTLESLYYGAAMAIMMASVFLWFSCYNLTMTTDKMVYLFGRISPSLSLILSMTLRFVPRFKSQFSDVIKAQRCLDVDVENGRIWQRMKGVFRIFSIMVTWSLDNAMDTADSMKSRGYGLKGRTAFSIFTITKRDFIFMGTMACCVSVFLAAVLMDDFYYRYFPSVKVNIDSGLGQIGVVGYVIFCLAPFLINVLEDFKWKYFVLAD